MNTKNEKTSDKKVDELKRSRSSGELKSLKVQKLNGKPRRDSEDEFTLGGKRYVARTFNPCKGCVFSSFPGTCSQYARPPCDSERRRDGRDVFFVLKETED